MTNLDFLIDDLRRNWNRKADGWSRHIGADGDSNRRTRLRPTAERWLGDVRNCRALDAGCGTGWMAGVLAELGAKVTAVDFSEEMVRIARQSLRDRYLEANFRQDDCQRLDTCGDGEFDLVTSIYVLQDLPDLDAALGAFARVMRPGGQCVLAFSHPCFSVPGGPVKSNAGPIYQWAEPYFQERSYMETWEGTDCATGQRFAFADEFVCFHRPLHQYWKAFRKAGFRVLDLDEPFPDGEEAAALPYPMMVHLERESDDKK